MKTNSGVSLRKVGLLPRVSLEALMSGVSSRSIEVGLLQRVRDHDIEGQVGASGVVPQEDVSGASRGAVDKAGGFSSGGKACSCAGVE